MVLTQDDVSDLHEEAGEPRVVDVLGQVLQQDRQGLFAPATQGCPETVPSENKQHQVE